MASGSIEIRPRFETERFAVVVRHPGTLRVHVIAGGGLYEHPESCPYPVPARRRPRKGRRPVARRPGRDSIVLKSPAPGPTAPRVEAAAVEAGVPFDESGQE